LWSSRWDVGRWLPLGWSMILSQCPKYCFLYAT
jgi:hypothetical protein